MEYDWESNNEFKLNKNTLRTLALKQLGITSSKPKAKRANKSKPEPIEQPKITKPEPVEQPKMAEPEPIEIEQPKPKPQTSRYKSNLERLQAMRF
eukprot:TRINITY_DN600946_c0_g1_i1.p1 TRINITY_DN600946_c0_g1~~TRINITY_DN600946_c0_g1_i1.p1  ORF type:complete len:104 (+),score=28.38 TRINITY_DN600946_c0_g1_i1:29-313(+)